MAGDWIKIEHATASKPEVWRIADTLGIDRDAALGMLVRFWCWCDQNLSEKCPEVFGHLSMIDSLLGRTGAGQALVDAGWLRIDGKSMSIPGYDGHLSKSAKNRAEDAKRKRQTRQNPDTNRTNGGHLEDIQRTEPGLEKRREEKNTKKPPTPLQGDAPRNSEKQSTNVDATDKAKAKRKGPSECVTIEVLRDTAKLVRWWRFASNCGLVDGTENSRLNVVGVACQVLGSEAVRDPVKVFVATVRDKAWDRIGEAADEQARRRLKDFDQGKRAGNVAPEIAAALGKLAAAKASRATAEDLAAYGDGDCDE